MIGASGKICRAGMVALFFSLSLPPNHDKANISKKQNRMKQTVITLLALFVGWMGTYAAATDDEYATRRDAVLSQITGAQKPTQRFSLTSLGARGDGVRDCKPAFDKAMRRAARMGGAHIVVPAGTYFIKGPIHLVSNVCLELERGAVLRFSSDAQDYLPLVLTSWEGTFLYNYSPMIYGYGLHDVSIIGEGTIDGNCAETFGTWRSRQKPAQQHSRRLNHEEVPVEERRFGPGHWLRPQLIQFYDCKNITLEQVFITNSPFWCVHLLQSENIVCRGIRYDAKLVNNDGIDPECSRNILIEDIRFDNGDDNVAIKSGRDNDGWRLGRPSENIVIRNCHFKGLHAVVIGSEMSAGVQNVFVENCDFAGYNKRGIYIKTNPDRGGFVRNVYVKNCTFDEVEDLFYVTSRYAGEGQESTNFSEISNIRVDGLRCRKVNAAALVLQGTAARPIRDVSFHRVEVGEAKNSISFEHVEGVSMSECFIGGRAGVPTQAASADKLFDR